MVEPVFIEEEEFEEDDDEFDEEEQSEEEEDDDDFTKIQNVELKDQIEMDSKNENQNESIELGN